jgi:hypothetical protein
MNIKQTKIPKNQKKINGNKIHYLEITNLTLRSISPSNI